MIDYKTCFVIKIGKFRYHLTKGDGEILCLTDAKIIVDFWKAQGATLLEDEKESLLGEGFSG